MSLIYLSGGSSRSYADRGSRSVVIRKLWDERPVYHAIRFDLPRTLTRCGLDLWFYDADGRPSSSRGHWLPLKHARKFGRPCARCWP